MSTIKIKELGSTAISDITAGLRRYVEIVRGAATAQDDLAVDYDGEDQARADTLRETAAGNRRVADEIEQTLNLLRKATRIDVYYWE